ncbi:MAG TPA: FAD/NAD(P)-binding oxidoreductase [Nitrososphaera sp.]|nr:FAD/NAD(P)-binding oxidoreductase [Nitrososphaera sp.]
MGKRILILGAGFGGLAAANELRKNLRQDHHVIVIDRKNRFMMGLVKLWILEGTRSLEESQTPLDGLNAKGIEYLNDEVVKIDTAAKSIHAKGHGRLEYDYLIVALGAELAPEKIAGFVGRGYNLYDPQEVPKLRERLLSFNRGKVAIAIMGMPYKCPPAPYEASIIISNLLAKSGKRDAAEIDLYSPAPIALPVAGPQISATVVDIVSQHGIRFHPSHKLKTVSDTQLEFENGTKRDYDVLVGIPPHRVPEVVRNSGLAAGGDWVPIDRHTMKTAANNVFAIGDVTEIKIGSLALPKAGIFAEEQARTVAQQIVDEIENRPSISTFAGRGYCFMEVGNKRAGYLEADFYNQAGPLLRLDAPSEQNFEKKQDFERTRVKDWLF